MALLTPLPELAAADLLVAYGLVLDHIEPLTLGSVNSNFRLRTRDGAVFFARIYEEQGERGAELEIALLDALLQAGLPVARALSQSNGQRVLIYQGKPFVVFPWVVGTITCQRLVNRARAQAIGQALARLHLATPTLPVLGAGRFGIPQVFERLDLALTQGGSAWLPVVDEIRTKLRYYEALRDPALPQGVIHGDLFRDNVLWDGDQLAVLLDFESASTGVFMYDLMVTLLAWCYGEQLDLELAQAMVGGYQSVRAITPAERVGALAEGAIACLRFATTRITDFALRARPGETPGRDYRRFLGRLRELEAGALGVVLG